MSKPGGRFFSAGFGSLSFIGLDRYKAKMFYLIFKDTVFTN